MTNITIRTKEYVPQLYRFGLPYRMSGADFLLRSACQSIQLADSDVHGVRNQEEHYRIAVQDEPGWLMFVLGSSYLDRAKHIAANIMLAYSLQNRQAVWVKNIGDFSTKTGTQLYIFDALFEDDNAYRRSMFYEAIQKSDSPNVSIILLGRTDNPIAFSRHIGLKPNLVILTK